MWPQPPPPSASSPLPPTSPPTNSSPGAVNTYAVYRPQPGNHQHQNGRRPGSSSASSTSSKTPSSRYPQAQAQQGGVYLNRPYPPALQPGFPASSSTYPGQGQQPSMSMPVPNPWSHSSHLPPQHQTYPSSPSAPAGSSRLPSSPEVGSNYPSQPPRQPSAPTIPPHPHRHPSLKTGNSVPQPLPMRHPAHIDDDAEYRAALAASQLSAQEEAALRRTAEAEEMKKLEELHRKEQEDRLQRQAELRRQEEDQMRLVMEQSRAEEERIEREAAEREARALEESRIHAAREALKREQEEQEEMRRVMEASLREEWERRREAEEEEVRTVERIRREIEEERQLRKSSSSRPSLPDPIIASGTNVDSGVLLPTELSESSRTRRPLPSIPSTQPPASQPSPQEILSQDDAEEAETVANPSAQCVELSDDQPEDDDEDPFDDAAEAPPAYDHVGADRPPEAPSRAPTGFWDEARARRIREERAANAGRPAVQTTPHVVTDPIEEKRRMEAAGARDVESPEGSRQSNINRTSSGRPMQQPWPLQMHQHDQAATSASNQTYRPTLSPLTQQISEDETNALLSPSSPASNGRPQASPIQDQSSPAGSVGSGQSQEWQTANVNRQSSRSSVTSATSRITMTSTQSYSRTDAGHTTQTSNLGSQTLSAAYGKGRASSTSPANSEISVTRNPRPGQTAPLGIDWGYSETAFALKLKPGPKENFYKRGGISMDEQGTNLEATMSEEEEASLKARFPNVITLKSTRMSENASDSMIPTLPFFTMRCGSWKILLRALAWLGNTRIEAGPEEVADAAERNRVPLLRMEVEFVTPSFRKGGTGRYGIEESPTGARTEEAAARAGQRNGMRPTACVSVCVSLCQQDDNGLVHHPHSGVPSHDPNNSRQSGARRHAERELDMEYLKRGSDRRVLNLPPSSMGLAPVSSDDTKAGLGLPTTLIKLAEHLQKAHRFSASCPTSGYAARHSPRDLYHTIEAHDDKYIGRLQKDLLSQSGQGVASSTFSPVGGLVLTPLQSNRSSDDTSSSSSASASDSHNNQRLLPLSSAYPAGPPLLLWDEGSIGHAPPNSITSASNSSMNPLLTPLSYSSLGSIGGGSGTNGSTGSGVNDGYSSLSSGVIDGSERSHLGRMKDRVKKKLKGRQGDVGEGEELANWITPLDLSEVGGGEEEEEEEHEERRDR